MFLVVRRSRPLGQLNRRTAETVKRIDTLRDPTQDYICLKLKTQDTSRRCTKINTVLVWAELEEVSAHLCRHHRLYILCVQVN